MGKDDGQPAEAASRWLHWLLWWRIDLAELERQAAAYETLGMIGSARGFCFLLALTIGLGMFSLASDLMSQGGDALHVWPVAAVLSFNLSGGMLLFVLAEFVYRGRRWAMLGCMVLWSGNVLNVLGLWALHASPQTFWPGIAFLILAWGWVMRPFHLAYRIERRRAAA